VGSLRIDGAFFKPKADWAGQRWANRRAFRRRPTSPELLAATARQIDRATREMSKIGVASAHAELVFPGLI
jgi:hypothetical protein